MMLYIEKMLFISCLCWTDVIGKTLHSYTSAEAIMIQPSNITQPKLMSFNDQTSTSYENQSGEVLVNNTKMINFNALKLSARHQLFPPIANIIITTSTLTASTNASVNSSDLPVLRETGHITLPNFNENYTQNSSKSHNIFASLKIPLGPQEVSNDVGTIIPVASSKLPRDILEHTTYPPTDNTYRNRTSPLITNLFEHSNDDILTNVMSAFNYHNVELDEESGQVHHSRYPYTEAFVNNDLSNNADELHHPGLSNNRNLDRQVNSNFVKFKPDNHFSPLPWLTNNDGSVDAFQHSANPVRYNQSEIVINRGKLNGSILIDDSPPFLTDSAFRPNSGNISSEGRVYMFSADYNKKLDNPPVGNYIGSSQAPNQDTTARGLVHNPGGRHRLDSQGKFGAFAGDAGQLSDAIKPDTGKTPIDQYNRLFVPRPNVSQVLSFNPSSDHNIVSDVTTVTPFHHSFTLQTDQSLTFPFVTGVNSGSTRSDLEAVRLNGMLLSVNISTTDLVEPRITGQQATLQRSIGFVTSGSLSCNPSTVVPMLLSTSLSIIGLTSCFSGTLGRQ